MSYENSSQRGQQDPQSGTEQSWKLRSQLAESITNASIDSMIALDTNLNVISWNDMAAVWGERSRDEVIGKAFFDIFPDARKTPGLSTALQEALKGRKSFLPTAQGFYLPGYFETHFVPLKDADGNVTGVLQIIHDVSHRIQAENHLKQLNHRLITQNNALQHANEEAATFAKVAAHDLKEPLRKIYTFVEMLKVHEAGKLSDAGKAHFRSIQKSVQRMGLLTDDIVNFLALGSRHEAVQEVDLEKVLSDVLAEFKSEIAHTGAIVHNTDLFSIHGYAHAIAQLFRQLIGNALKFHKKGEPPRITIKCERMYSDEIPLAEARKDEEYYCLSVADNGIGFEPQFNTRIFGLFERLHPQGTYRGSGMGLAIAQKAARMHEGFMRAEGTPDNGSIFYCYIPVYKSADIELYGQE